MHSARAGRSWKKAIDFDDHAAINKILKETENMADLYAAVHSPDFGCELRNWLANTCSDKGEHDTHPLPSERQKFLLEIATDLDNADYYDRATKTL